MKTIWIFFLVLCLGLTARSQQNLAEICTRVKTITAAAADGKMSKFKGKLIYSGKYDIYEVNLDFTKPAKAAYFDSRTEGKFDFIEITLGESGSMDQFIHQLYSTHNFSLKSCTVNEWDTEEKTDELYLNNIGNGPETLYTAKKGKGQFDLGIRKKTGSPYELCIRIKASDFAAEEKPGK